MEKAIKLAKQGGYFWDSECECVCTESYLMDKDFWIGLGKQQGWEYWLCEHCGNNVCYRGSGPTNSIPVAQCVTHGDVERIEGYKYHWHSFIDHIAEGKSVDDFFNQILK